LPVEVRLGQLPWCFVRCAANAGHYDALVIAVDGVCRSNSGAGNGIVALTVRVGPGSAHNVQQDLRTMYARPTALFAELLAALMGLLAARDIAAEWAVDGHPLASTAPLRQVIIKTPSEFLVRGMSEWVFVGRRNYVPRGERAEEAQVLQLHEKAVAELNDLGVSVLFWHAPRPERQSG
jgi:ribonuclease HI